MYSDAEKWLRLAAEQKYAKAQYSLGEMYANSSHVPKDYSEAIKWYRLAAEQGYTPAQHSLGVMYAEGYGVPKDNTEAEKWFKKSEEREITEQEIIFTADISIPYKHRDCTFRSHDAAISGGAFVD